jgi:HD-like signal output (HDOD) protein
MRIQKFATELEGIITRRIAADELVLPTLPAVALEVQAILRDPDAGMKEVAKALEKDPLLSARALRMATSAAFAAADKKATLQEALARLGAKTIKSLLVEAAAQQIFVSRNPTIDQQLKVLWKHSVAVGELAREVLSLSPGAEAEGAYLPGLLHDVGKPIVATMLLELERQLGELEQKDWIDSGQWLEVVAAVHRPVGVALAERWELQEGIVACIKDSQEYSKEEGASFSNAVCFSNALAKKSAVYAGAVDAERNESILEGGRAVLGISEDQLATLTHGIGERMAGLYA